MGKPYRNSLLKIEPSKSCFKVELNSIKGFKTRKDRLCKSDPFSCHFKTVYSLPRMSITRTSKTNTELAGIAKLPLLP